jgi:hypothetical protein
MRESLGCALYIRCALSPEKYGNWYLHILKEKRKGKKSNVKDTKLKRIRRKINYVTKIRFSFRKIRFSFRIT